MRAGKNIWKCREFDGCGHEFKSEEKPDVCPECGWYIVEPKINTKRVHGHTYQHYQGNSDWDECANRVLRRLAIQNFRR